MLMILLRALLLLASFAGLCAAIRTGLKINRFFAPFMAVSGIIAVLMFAGMLRLLRPAAWALYILGFMGLAYSYGLRREKPDWPLIVSMLALAALAGISFFPHPIFRSDDLSHWGLVARHLLKYNAFPDGNASWVQFQAYPLGSACFIYYAARFIADTEGMYLAAQAFLLGPLFLPLLACIPRERKILCPAFAAAALVYFAIFRIWHSLRVDILLSLFGIAVTACAVHYRNDWKKAFLTALPGMIAVVYIKSSGMFFAFIGALLLGRAACLSTGKRKNGWIALAAAMAAFTGAYLLWTLHIRLSYPAALETKHAVSLSAYADRMAEKGIGTIVQIFISMALALVKPSPMMLGTLALAAASLGAAIFICRILPDGRALRPRLLKQLALCLGCYVLWLAMIYFMYIFSMPLSEALELASLRRYNGTGVAYLAGLVMMVLFPHIARAEITALRPVKLLRPLCTAFCLLFVVAGCIWNMPSLKSGYATKSMKLRRGLEAARAEYGLQNGDPLMILLSKDAHMNPYNAYYHVKYEFETADVQIIWEEDGRVIAGTRFDKGECSDVGAFIAEHIDDCRAALVLMPNELLEAELENCLAQNPSRTPVVRTYEYY